jgi:hypothetical protein
VRSRTSFLFSSPKRGGSVMSDQHQVKKLQPLVAILLLSVVSALLWWLIVWALIAILQAI